MPVLVGGKKTKKQFKPGGWIAVGLGLPAVLVMAAIANWQENKSEPTPQVAVSQASPASSVAAAPAPVPSVAPSPKPVAPPRAAGIGVSRATVQAVFEQPDIGFSFKASSNVDGQPRVMGTSPNGLATIELIGPSNDLVSATIMTGLPNDDEQAQMLNIAYTLGFIKKAAPEWTNGGDWFTDNMVMLTRNSYNKTSTTFADKKAELTLLREMGIFTLKISPN